MSGSKKRKNDNCWQCGIKLNQPFQGQEPAKHDCGRGDCVVCPKCNSPLCAYDKSDKAQKAKKFKDVAAGAAPATPRQDGPADEPANHAKRIDTSDLPAVDPCPEVFPALLQQYVSEGAHATGCPTDYFVNAMMAAAGAAKGLSREIVLKGDFEKKDFTQVAVVYAANIGEPGSAKSPAAARVLRPIRERQEKLLHEHREALRQFHKQKAAKAKSSNKPKGERGAPAQDDLDLGRFDAGFDPLSAKGAQQEPKLVRLLTDDVTVESLADIMSVNQRGVGVFRDELIAWVRGMDMYRKGKGTDRQF